MSDESDRGADLFDRWLTHRQETAKDRPAPVRRPATPPRTPDTARPATEDAPAARVEQAEPQPADLEPADPAPEPEPDPLFDAAFVAAEPEPAVLFEATAPPEVRVPIDFEPVIIPSARKKKPEPRRSRRRPTPAPAQEVEPELRPAPTPDPTPDPGPEALLEPQQEAVPDTEPEPQPVPEPDPDPEPPKPQTPLKPRARKPRPPKPRSALDHPDAASAAVAVARDRRRAEPAPAVSGNTVFAPRTGSRRAMGVLLLLAVGATAVAAYVANEQQTTPTIGIATALGVLTLIIWAVRAGTSVTRMSVTAGQLEVLRGGGRFVFDLRSTYTPIEVVGDPGRRGWQVLIHRRGMTPFVIDASMVDPEEFMRVLRHHRPAEPPAADPSEAG